MRTLVGAVVLLGAFHAQARARLAVIDVVATDVDPKFIPVLTEVVAAELVRTELYDVASPRDVQATLSFETQRQLAGCNDVLCISEIAGALGVEKLVVTEV